MWDTEEVPTSDHLLLQAVSYESFIVQHVLERILKLTEVAYVHHLLCELRKPLNHLLYNGSPLSTYVFSSLDSDSHPRIKLY